MKTTIDIFLALIVPMSRDSQHLKNEFLSAVEALNNLDRIEIDIPETLTSSIEIKEVKKISSELNLLWKTHRLYLR